MNDEVKARLIRYADQLEAAAGKGADFLAEQAPETVRQFLAWHFWSGVIECITCAVVSALALVLSYRCHQAALKHDTFDEQLHLVSGALAAVGTSAAIFAAWSFATVLKVWIAPNVFIIEKLAEMAK